MTHRFERDTFIAAPVERVFDLSLSIDLHLGSMTESRERAVAGVRAGKIGLDEEVTWRAWHFGLPWRMTVRITALEPLESFVDEQVRGPFAWYRHEHRYEAVEGGTRMIDHVGFGSPFGPLGRLAERIVIARHVEKLIDDRNDYLAATAEGHTTGEPPRPA